MQERLAMGELSPPRPAIRNLRPSVGAWSITVVGIPASAMRIAAVRPAGPPPTTSPDDARALVEFSCCDMYLATFCDFDAALRAEPRPRRLKRRRALALGARA